MPRNHTVANMPKFAALGQSLLRTAVTNHAALPANNNMIPTTGSRLKLTTMAPANMMPKQIHLIIAILGHCDSNKCQHKTQHCSHNRNHIVNVFNHIFYWIRFGFFILSVHFLYSYSYPIALLLRRHIGRQ